MKKNAGLTRRGFLKGAGVGAVAGAAAVVGGSSVVTTDSAQAAIQTSSVLPYEALMQGSGRIYAKSDTCNAPTGNIGFEETITGSIEDSSEQYDVIVVGGGITGMAAALRVADLGKKVLVLEKMTAARGMFEDMGVVGSQMQVGHTVQGNVLVQDDAYKVNLLKRIYDRACCRLRRGPVHTYIEYSGIAADFIDSMLRKGENGMYLEAATDTVDHEEFYSFKEIETLCNVRFRDSIGYSAGRPGVYVVRELAWVGRKRYPDNFFMKLEAPVAQLINEIKGEGENRTNKVTGVISKQKGKYIRYNCDKVILATGGYDDNPDMLSAYCRTEDYADICWWNGSFSATGDGHMMGLKAGALMDQAPHAVMNFNLARPVGKQFNRSYMSGATDQVGSGIVVNRNGERFMNENERETGEFAFTVHSVAAQEMFGKHCWVITTQPMGFSGSTKNNPVRQEEIKQEYKDAHAYFDGEGGNGGSLQELAEYCGIDAEALEKTVRHWNSYCTNGLDKEFGRVVNPSKALNGPYYALKTAPGFMLTTVCGLQVTKDFQVLDAVSERPIEGLYAGGNVSGCFFSGYYPRSIAGISIGRAITSGYIAATHAINGSVDHDSFYD